MKRLQIRNEYQADGYTHGLEPRTQNRKCNQQNFTRKNRDKRWHLFAFPSSTSTPRANET